MLSKSCIYAIRSIIYIAQESSPSQKIGIQEISKELELPTHYTAKILQQLTKHRVIQSVKGPNGGFFVNEEKSHEIKIITIIEIFDGLDFFTNCGLGLNQCSDEHPCPLHNDFVVYRDGLLQLFSSKSIFHLVKMVKEGSAFVRNNPKK